MENVFTCHPFINYKAVTYTQLNNSHGKVSLLWHDKDPHSSIWDRELLTRNNEETLSCLDQGVTEVLL